MSILSCGFAYRFFFPPSKNHLTLMMAAFYVFNYLIENISPPANDILYMFILRFARTQPRPHLPRPDTGAGLLYVQGLFASCRQRQ